MELSEKEKNDEQDIDEDNLTMMMEEASEEDEEDMNCDLHLLWGNKNISGIRSFNL